MSDLNNPKCLEMQKFVFTTLNIRGLNNNQKGLNLMEWLIKNNFNFVFLQETFSTLDKEKELINTFSKFGKIFLVIAHLLIVEV
jgi:hypothetical protein